VASSDSNAREALWAQHYRAASARRRARGWHRHDESRPRSRVRLPGRVKLYLAAALAFVALTVLALALPR